MKVFIALLLLWTVHAHEVGVLQPTQAPPAAAAPATPAPAATAAPAAAPRMIVPQMMINPVIDHCGRCQAAQDNSHPSCGLCSSGATRQDVVKPITMSAMLELEYGRMIAPQMMVNPVYDRKACNCRNDAVDVRVVHPISVSANNNGCNCNSLLEEQEQESAAPDATAPANATAPTAPAAGQNATVTQTAEGTNSTNSTRRHKKRSLVTSAVILTGPVPDPSKVLGVPKGTFGWAQCHCDQSDPKCGCVAAASAPPPYLPPSYQGSVYQGAVDHLPLPKVEGETVAPSVVPRNTFKNINNCCGTILTPGCVTCAKSQTVAVGPNPVAVNGGQQVHAHPDGSATIVLPSN